MYGLIVLLVSLIGAGAAKYGPFPCPSGNIVNCFVDPCQVTSCSKFPKAVCKPDFCEGCNARFFIGGKEVTKQCCKKKALPSAQCPPDKPVVNCLVDPCSAAVCPKFSSAKCKSDFCGGCFAKFFLKGKEVTDQCKVNSVTGQYKKRQLNCPREDIWHCLINPCDVIKCPAYPKASCRADYCRGCRARFYMGNKEVTSKCHEVSSGGCPNHKPLHHCKVEPCTVSHCNINNARCEDDFCGGCNARWFVGRKEVTNKCHEVIPEPTPNCPPGDIWHCLIDPCTSFTCPKYPKAKCKADYCRGCNARFYWKGKEVTKMCHGGPKPKICPHDRPVVNCFVHPCRFGTCPNHPNAQCFSDNCNGCLARWYIGNVEVTDSCNNKPVFIPKCKYGTYFKDLGQPPSCNPKSSLPQCPEEYICVGGLAEELGYCCKRENPCTKGLPYTKDGNAPNCIGLGKITCPKSYTCVGNATSSSVCCPWHHGPTPLNPCSSGKPLPNIFCGRGPNRKDCPIGYSCKIDPADRYAVCCKDTNNPFPPVVQFKRCPFGSAVVNGTGQRIICNAFRPVPSPPQCPAGTQCIGGPADEPGSCCLKSSPCTIGNPFTRNGDASPCRGPNAIECPDTHECKTGSNPLYSVCCEQVATIIPVPPFPTPVLVKKCPYGGARDKNGKRIACSPFLPPGSPSQCPKGTICIGGPADEQGTCCLAKNPCEFGVPLASNGDAHWCGGGPGGSIRCPASYSCIKMTNPRVSVCCRNKPAFIPKCKYGTYFKDLGQPPSCNPKSSLPQCPEEYICVGGPADQPGYCCKRENPCTKGLPYMQDGNAPNCIGLGHITCPKPYKCVGNATSSSVCCPWHHNPTPLNPCSSGKPLPNIFCGRGPNRKDCPTGYSCKIDPADRYAVCCKDTNNPFPPVVQFKRCPFGSAVVNGTGQRIICNAFRPVPSPPQCPAGTQCIGGPADEPGSCCLKSSPCTIGKPYTRNGDAPPCRGPNAIECPDTHECKTGSNPLYSVCCEQVATIIPVPPFPTPVPVKKCQYGGARDKNGKRITCSPFQPTGSPSQCPKGTICIGGPADEQGTCCLAKNPCEFGVPLASNGDAHWCGGGPGGSIRCPASYGCIKMTNPRVSVCCRNKPAFIPKCKYGTYFKDLGQIPSCNPESSQPQCPEQYICTGGPAGRRGYCCKRENPCTKGLPYMQDGNAPNCIGLGHITCPKSYTCVGNATSSSVCCPWRHVYGGCPPNKSYLKCQVDLCKVIFCPNLPKAKCRMKECGKRCDTVWTVGGRDVTKQCKEGGPQKQCPKDKPFAFCFIHPCAMPSAKCPRFPHATCYGDQCGGCTPRWFINKKEVTKQCFNKG